MKTVCKKWVEMKKQILKFILVLGILIPQREASAWSNPADTMYLAQLVANALKQLYELQQIVRAGQDSLNLMRDINRGINDSMTAVDSIAPLLDPGLYKELRNVAQIIEHFRRIYGTAARSPDEKTQNDTDQVVAESISLTNSLYEYAKELDQLGERIKSFSHNVSPGGAQKLTAQSLGVMVHIMNQQMRAQGQAMKIQAQAMAIQNKKDKDQTRTYLEQTGTLKKAMKQADPKFEFPRF